MTAPTPFLLSSGDLIADRRYVMATDLARRGDLAASIDLLSQALERAPGFAAAWFALGHAHEQAGDASAAVAAFRAALETDPADRHGAALHLARLGVPAPGEPMSPSYVRMLFDQYAPRYEAELIKQLGYCGPALLREAVEHGVAVSGRPPRFGRMLDLGCGTGLAGEAFRDCCDTLIGFDLAPAMIEQARRKGLYAELVVGDMVESIGREREAGADLVIAADALVYVRDLAVVCHAVARALAAKGILAFTVETHAGAGVILGDRLRFAHGAFHVRDALETAGLAVLRLEAAPVRTESGDPVPGLVAVAAK